VCQQYSTVPAANVAAPVLHRALFTQLYGAQVQYAGITVLQLPSSNMLLYLFATALLSHQNV
jgi:hypothetical protein